MDIRDRIGIDFSRRLAMEDALKWSIEHGIRYMDCNIDLAPNPLESFDDARCAPIRDGCRQAGIQPPAFAVTTCRPTARSMRCCVDARI